MSTFWFQALCTSAKNAGDADCAHSRDWKWRRRGRESQCQPSPLPPEGCVPAKLSHNLSASSQCQPQAHSHALPRTGPSPHREHSPHAGIGQAANSTPKSHLSCPSKLKAVHKRGWHHTSERWSKLFSLIKPISSNESLLLGLNSSEINPKAAKPPHLSAQRQLFYSFRQHWVNTTTSNHTPGADLQVDIFKANVFPAAVQSPLLKAQSAKTTSSGSNSRYPQKNILQVSHLYTRKQYETSPETTCDGKPFHGKFFYNI